MSLTKEGYRERIVDGPIARNLKAFGAVSLEGPKWCGKTWTALHHANSACYIASPENNFQFRTLAILSPELVLEGESPRLIDEWQEVLPLWDAVRHVVDQDSRKGRFILTGSATPPRVGVLHSGTGRVVRMHVRPMSLFESGDSSGQVSLENLFSGTLRTTRIDGATLDRLIAWTVRGGWPGSLGLDEESAAELPKAYLRNVLEEDVRRIDAVNRNARKMQLLLRSIARNESTVVSHRTLRSDMLEDAGESIHVDTISDYLEVLSRLHLMEDQPAFAPGLRSSVRVGKSPKRHFADPSLAVAALGATPEKLRNDLHTFGFLFEALCVRDLRIYAESFGAQVFHYRDDAGREIDAVVELPDGTWGAFEIKLGANQIDEAARGLLAIREMMKADPTAKPPEILCVVCGLGNAAYVREDGVMVVPLTVLGP